MSKKRLLVIEDDTDVAEMLQVYFVGQGYDVFSALTGTDGVSMARSKSPNLILLDVMLPDMDGFDVCKSLRTTTLTKYIPITFLTQRDRRADKVSGLELGADDYVTKPFDIEELRLRVQAQLRRASREALQDIRTGLPTGEMIQETHNQLQLKDGWKQYQVNLMGFKAFRDRYGFVAADEALAFVGQAFVETIATKGTADDFAGVLDEDKLVVYTFAPDADALLEALNTRVREGVKPFYNMIDREQGYVIINEAHDDEQFIPLMRLEYRKVAERAAAQVSENKT